MKAIDALGKLSADWCFGHSAVHRDDRANSRIALRGSVVCSVSSCFVSGAEGRVHAATNACTSGLFKISVCAILLARSKRLSTLDLSVAHL